MQPRADRPDPLAPERSAFLAASNASMDATLDAAALQAEGADDRRLRAAVQLMADRQARALAALDRMIRRGTELQALDQEAESTLREQRASLALTLQRTRAEIERLA